MLGWLVIFQKSYSGAGKGACNEVFSVCELTLRSSCQDWSDPELTPAYVSAGHNCTLTPKSHSDWCSLGSLLICFVRTGEKTCSQAFGIISDSRTMLATTALEKTPQGLQTHISLYIAAFVASQVAEYKVIPTEVRTIVKAHVYSDAQGLCWQFYGYFLDFIRISISTLVYAFWIYPGLNCQNQFSKKTNIVSLTSKRDNFLSLKDKEF